MGTIKKEASKDAFEYAAARMSYGEGAGTRRKLIGSAVEYKASKFPGYKDAFDLALANQNLDKHVKVAKRNRRIKDISGSANRNIKALARGDRNGMSTPIIVGVVVLGVAHQTGYDKKAWAYGKQKVREARAWLKAKL